MQWLPELHGYDAYGDNKSTVFGDKVSREPENKQRKAESAEVLTQEAIQAPSDSRFLPQLLPLAPHCCVKQSDSHHGHRVSYCGNAKELQPIFRKQFNSSKKFQGCCFHSKSCFLSKNLLQPLLSIPLETFLPQQITLSKSHGKTLATQV